MKPLKLNLYFSTSDLSLSAAISLYYPLESIDASEQKAEFLFKREPGLDELIHSYYIGELLVSPTKYFAQLKLIKTRLYEARKEQGNA